MVVQLRRGHRPLRKVLQRVADEGISVEEHFIFEKDVIDADDARLVQIGVVQLEGATMQGEVEGIVHVMIEVGPGAHDEVNRAALHQREDDAPHASGCHRASDGQADGDIFFGVEHHIGIKPRRLVEPARVIGLEGVVNEISGAHLLTQPLRSNAVAGEVVAWGLMRLCLASGLGGAFMRAVWHGESRPFGMPRPAGVA